MRGALFETWAAGPLVERAGGSRALEIESGRTIAADGDEIGLLDPALVLA